MGVFDDKKFEELDWISQATEPIDSKLNEALGLFPESIELDFNLFMEMLGEYISYTNELTTSKAADYLLKKYDIELHYSERNILSDLIKFEIDEGTFIDFERKAIVGGLRLIKTASTTDEKLLEKILGREGIEACGSMHMEDGALSRANEILELLGKCEKGLRTRSSYKKRDAIRRRLVEIFKTNEWKIKDTELANKVGFWIRNYVSNGNLAALSNFCRLKVMTHKDQPIYSMEEVE